MSSSRPPPWMYGTSGLWSWFAHPRAVRRAGPRRAAPRVSVVEHPPLRTATQLPPPRQQPAHIALPASPPRLHRPFRRCLPCPRSAGAILLSLLSGRYPPFPGPVVAPDHGHDRQPQVTTGRFDAREMTRKTCSLVGVDPESICTLEAYLQEYFQIIVAKLREAREEETVGASDLYM